MNEFEYSHVNKKEAKKEGKISTAIHNLKNILLDPNDIHDVEKKSKDWAEKCDLSREKLLRRTLQIIREGNGGVLPEHLEKYEK